MELTFWGGMRSARQFLSEHSWLQYVVVFLILFLLLKLSLYILLEFSTSPAIIFPSVGIAFAAIFLGGYRMAIPVALASLFAYVTISPLPPLVPSLIGIAAYTLQPLIGAFVLRHFNFNAALTSTKDAVVFTFVALIVPAIAPTLSTSAGMMLHTLSTTPWQTWSIGWAGGVLSVMAVTPFIFTWLRPSPVGITRKKYIEKFIACSILLFPIYLLFWIPPPINSFIILYFFFGILFWIGLRMGPRIMTLALFLIAALSITGTLIFPPIDMTISERLLSIELFIILIAPFFLILSSLVEERRVIAIALRNNIDELEEALSEISTADAAKSEFIAILAHELRNPLAPIVSSLEWLKLQEQTQESLDTIKIAESHTYTIRRLLDDLLDVARIAQKKFRLQKKNAELHDLLTIPLHSVENYIASQNHELIVSLPEEMIFLNVDPIRFQQIIVNLLSNAAKYTPKGGRIELRGFVQEKELVLEVEDNGRGINPVNLTKIFNLFRQFSQRSQNAGGLGLGLYLTKTLVEMHGGSIHVWSEGQGKGTTFTVRLPLHAISTQQGAQSETLTPEMKETKTEVQERKILLVDDNVVLANGLRKLLEYKGYEVQLAHTGLEALVALDTHKPDVIFLDIGLPDMDGYEIAREIKERKIETVIIALTGYGQEKDRTMAKEAGFDYHLVKPVGIDDIELILKEAFAEKETSS